MVDFSLTSLAQQGASYLPAEAQAAIQSLLPQSPQDALPVTPVVPLAVAQRPAAPVVAAPAKSNMMLYIGLAGVAVGAFILYKKFGKKGKK